MSEVKQLASELYKLYAAKQSQPARPRGRKPDLEKLAAQVIADGDDCPEASFYLAWRCDVGVAEAKKTMRQMRQAAEEVGIDVAESKMPEMLKEAETKEKGMTRERWNLIKKPCFPGKKLDPKRKKLEVTAEEAQTVAKTILQRLGGMSRLKAMIGAKNFLIIIEQRGGVSFQFMPQRGSTAVFSERQCAETVRSRKPNFVKILFTAADTYTVMLGYIRGGHLRSSAEYSDVYAEQLKSLIERETGLVLSL